MSFPPPAVRALDLREVACPMTWVKTRVALERLSQGEELEVLLAEGEPARSVPESAAEDGHRVVALVELGEGQGVRLVIAKQERGGEPWR